MSIQPPSDIVLDVAQAADPVKSMAAAQRLMRISSPNGSSEDFSGVLGNLSPLVDNTANLRSRLNLPGGSGGAVPVATDARTKAYKGLEALIFQNLFETTLPHDESLGKGMAGGVWRSMMAEQLSKQIVKTVDLGLTPKSGGVESRHQLPSGLGKIQLPNSGTDTTGSSS